MQRTLCVLSVFTLAGEHVRSFNCNPMGAERKRYASGIAVPPAGGLIYVSDGEPATLDYSVQVFRTDGTHVHMAPIKTFKGASLILMNIAVSPLGFAYNLLLPEDEQSRARVLAFPLLSY